MVFFTCNACGESLKKAQVDKHVNMCRGCQVLSCIDCGKDFWGDDYKNHIKCISEDQKYGGKGFEAKANKGDVKQQQWIQRVHEAMNKPGVNAKLKDVLRQISSYDNVPRKKAKFQNWMKNSLKIANTSLHEEVWNIISAVDNTPEANQETKEPEKTAPEVELNHNESETNGHTKKKLNKKERKEARRQKNGKVSNHAEKTVAPEPKVEEEQMGKKKKKEKKRKHEDEADDAASAKKTKTDKSTDAADTLVPEETEDPVTGKFNWKGTIKAVLRDSPDQELSVKKLRKKVLAAFYSYTGDRNFKTEEELLSLFNKKVNNNPKFRVLKEKVRLIK